MVLAPISLFVAFLALMAKWLLTLSSYIVAPLIVKILISFHLNGSFNDLIVDFLTK